MRLIDGDALKIAIDDGWVPDMTVSEIWGVIDEIPTVATDTNVLGKWISVKDRLPDEGKAVLVYAPRYKNIFELVLVHGGWNYFGTGFIEEYNPYWMGEIACWMPLPEPPEEVDQG